MALFRTIDTGVLDLIEESGRNVQRATLLLRETLEQSVDACEKVAHVLEGISLKRGRRRRG